MTLGRGIRIIDEAFLRCDKVIYNEYNNVLYLGNEENPYFALVKVSHENAEYIEIHPDTVVICGGAMESCDLLREITIPDSAETVSYNAFSYCTKLEKAVIGSGTKHLGNNTFIGCTSLKEVVYKNPHGWTVRAMYGIFSNKIDVYNPQKNAENLTGEYLAYFWNR